MDISRRIRRFLTEGEQIRRQLSLKGRFSLRPDKVIYATNIRLIIDEREAIRDISYRHISSMAIRKNIHLPLILIGILVAVLGLVGLQDIFGDYFPDAVAGALIVIGVILAIFGLIPNKAIAITVAGRVRPYILEGTGVDLEELFILVRETEHAGEGIMPGRVRANPGF